MSNPGMHAADDGSFARSTGGAAARGAMLIALALIIGLLLMAFALDDPPTDLSTASGDSVETTEEDAATETADDEADSGETSVTVGEPEDETADPGPAIIDETDDVEEIPEEVEAPAGEARPASEVNVLVANGTGGKGVAGAVSDKLKAAAYIANPANAPSTAEAVIYYRVGYDADARAVATVLGAPPDIITPAPGDGTIAVAPEAISDGRLQNANVVVIIGNDGAIPVG